MDKLYQIWLKFIDNSVVRLFDSVVAFLKSKSGMLITVGIIIYFILY